MLMVWCREAFVGGTGRDRLLWCNGLEVVFSELDFIDCCFVGVRLL